MEKEKVIECFKKKFKNMRYASEVYRDVSVTDSKSENSVVYLYTGNNPWYNLYSKRASGHSNMPAKAEAKGKKKKW
jgi:hypothetical protein